MIGIRRQLKSEEFSMIKRYLYTLKLILFTTMIISGGLSADQISRPDFFIPFKLGDIELYHDECGFHVVKDNVKHDVQNAFLDPELRNISSERLDYFLGITTRVQLRGKTYILTRISDRECRNLIRQSESVSELTDDEFYDLQAQLTPGSYLSVSQLSDGEYKIQLKPRILGGGLWGATMGCWIGKFVASAICHGAIFVVSAAVSVVATPAAGYILGASLESTLGASIEAFTTAGAIAGGITLAVATGPI